MRLLGEGLETQGIAKRLGIADETARNHIRALLRAVGAHSRLEAVVMGMRTGVLNPHLTQPGHEGLRCPLPTTRQGRGELLAALLQPRQRAEGCARSRGPLLLSWSIHITTEGSN